MARTTNSDNKEVDSSNHWPSYASQSQNDKNPRRGRVEEENPS